jgi:uncharacterized membrane protein YcgQ (UPF0703/DUF1980 family)
MKCVVKNLVYMLDAYSSTSLSYIIAIVQPEPAALQRCPYRFWHRQIHLRSQLRAFQIMIGALFFSQSFNSHNASMKHFLVNLKSAHLDLSSSVRGSSLRPGRSVWFGITWVTLCHSWRECSKKYSTRFHGGERGMLDYEEVHPSPPPPHTQ